MKKRMLTVLLALVMIMAVVPFTAMATEEQCDHSSTYIEKEESTCIHEGVMYCFCKDCGVRRWGKVLELAPHAYGKDYKCTVCGTSCKKHAYGSEVRVEATCTEAGSVTKTCAECGYIYTVKTLKATGHKFTESVDGRVATCTVDGYTPHKKCSVCGEKDDSYEVIKATGHKLGADKDTAPTCTKSGTLEQHCENCDYTSKETRKKLGHNYVPVTGVAPTCTEEGYEDFEKCTRCGKQTEATPIPVIAHNYISVEAKASTCTQSGYKAHKVCTGCGKLSGFKSLPLIGHTYENGQCKACGAAAPNYSGTPAPGGSGCAHTAVSTYRTDATCEAVGYIVKACDNCHVEISREIISATGHTPKTTRQEPTCTEDGFEKVTCKVCKAQLSNTVLEHFGHSYNNGICSNCGGADSNKFTHDFQDVYVVG